MKEIKKQILQEMQNNITDESYGDDVIELLETKELYTDYNYTVLEHGIYDQSRWSVEKYAITEVTAKNGEHVMFIKSTWSAPATEMQEGQDTYLEIFEVVQREVATIKYVSV